jgi:hypothetical protein
MAVQLASIQTTISIDIEPDEHLLHPVVVNTHDLSVRASQGWSRQHQDEGQQSHPSSLQNSHGNSLWTLPGADDD